MPNDIKRQFDHKSHFQVFENSGWGSGSEIDGKARMKYQSEMVLNETEFNKLNHHEDGLSGEAVIDGKNRSPEYANKILNRQLSRNGGSTFKG